MPGWGPQGYGTGGYGQRDPSDQPVQREVTPGIKRWVWSSDGSSLSNDEMSARGIHDFDTSHMFDDAGNAIGFNPTLAGPGSGGASLDTSGADAERANMEQLIGSLEQQAATGSGAWEKTLRDSVGRAQNMASAVGQSNPNVNNNAAMENIGNSRAAAQQRGAGDAEKLRAESKLGAQDELSGILGGQAQTDITQSAEQARIERERRLANQASIDQTQQNRQNTEKSITGSMGMMSDGGRVPGKPIVFGDDSRNDTVPAMLSPEEIVVPISAAKDPDKAAAFARAVAERGGAKGLADGGNPDQGLQVGSWDNVGQGAGYFINPQLGRAMQYDMMRNKYGAGGGGTLDTSQFNETAGHQRLLEGMAGQEAGGEDFGAANASMQRHSDEAMGAALRSKAPSASVTDAIASAGEEIATQGASMRMAAQSRGQKSMAHAAQQGRAEQLQMGSAQQQAAWEKTLSDMGLSLDKQKALRGTLASAGQGAAAFSQLGGGKGGGSGDTQIPQEQRGSADFNENLQPDVSDLNSEPTSEGRPDDTGDTSIQSAAHGGMIHPMDDDEHDRAAKFIKALRSRKKAA